MAKAVFEFFELIADEFDGRSEVFFGIGRMQDGAGNPTALFLNLKAELKASSDNAVIPAAVKSLRSHFKDKGVTLPFEFEQSTSRFHSPNDEFLEFVRLCKGVRSLGQRAQEFELAILARLASRLQGELHRVGFPRQNLKTIKETNVYLRKHFDFQNDILAGKEKDGGLDILWRLPLGTSPFVPVVSIQCKNGLYARSEAASSLEASRASLNKHGWLHKEAHLNCVVFNDYITPKSLYPKGAEYVPIGLSDLLRAIQSPMAPAAI